jgi:hypothetical protein
MMTVKDLKADTHYLFQVTTQNFAWKYKEKPHRVISMLAI